jgi:hypothetical protein
MRYPLYTPPVHRLCQHGIAFVLTASQTKTGITMELESEHLCLARCMTVAEVGPVFDLQHRIVYADIMVCMCLSALHLSVGDGLVSCTYLGNIAGRPISVALI